MVEMLSLHVFHHAAQLTRTHRHHGVAFGPPQRRVTGRTCVDGVSGPALCSLQDPRKLRGGVNPDNEVQVGGDDSEGEHTAPLLPNHDRQVLGQVFRAGSVEARFAIPGGPYHVDDELMVHTPVCAMTWLTSASNERNECRLSDISRAVASATSMR